MKPRAPRRKVVIKARMRAGCSWTDVCVLNIGERGLGLQSAAPPVRGTYVEVCRGEHVLIGCVAWSSGHRFGVRTQDYVAVDAVVGEPDKAGGNGETTSSGLPFFERRAAPRPLSERGDRSRHIGRTLEFTIVAVLGLSAAVVASETIVQAIGKPMSSISVALKSH